MSGIYRLMLCNQNQKVIGLIQVMEIEVHQYDSYVKPDLAQIHGLINIKLIFIDEFERMMLKKINNSLPEKNRGH